jgi:PAS domain S-box-containing protein
MLQEAAMEKEKTTLKRSRGHKKAVDPPILVPRNATGSGNPDVQESGSVPLGQLLQAIPVPALLIDQSRRAIFANREWDEILPEKETFYGLPVAGTARDPGATPNDRYGIEDFFSMATTQACKEMVGTEEADISGPLFSRRLKTQDNPLILLVLKDLARQEKQLTQSQRDPDGLQEPISEPDGALEKLILMSGIFTESVDPIFITDLEGTIVNLNKAAKQTYGWDRDELIGKSFETIVSQDPELTADDLFGRCQRGEKVESTEALHWKKSGELMPVLLSLSLLTNAKGEPERIACITQNLTNMKRTEKTLRAKTEALERSNKDLEEFAYVAAHDMREPLVGIAAYLKLLQRRCADRLDEEAGKFVSRALDIALRMDGFIQSLLSYSLLGIASRSIEPTDCNVALHRAISNLAAVVEESGAKITTAFLPTVMGNPSEIVQLFQNLLSNAIKFAGDGPLEIRIDATLEESGWKFSVKDNGIGIEPPYFDRVFRIFQRLEASSERRGTGIGLANCKKIVEHHGGRIWVESVPGKGSTFFFTIPDRTASSDG